MYTPYISYILNKQIYTNPKQLIKTTHPLHLIMTDNTTYSADFIDDSSVKEAEDYRGIDYYGDGNQDTSENDGWRPTYTDQETTSSTSEQEMPDWYKP